MARNLYIENCEYTVEYECPYEWKNLQITDDSKIRFCNECNKNVYQCKTEKEMDKHIKLRHCIAVKERAEMGVIDFPESYYNNPDKNKTGEMIQKLLKNRIKDNDTKNQ